MSKKYDPQFREHAVRMVNDKIAAEHCSQRSALMTVSTSLGISAETQRGWIRQIKQDTPAH